MSACPVPHIEYTAYPTDTEKFLATFHVLKEVLFQELKKLNVSQDTLEWYDKNMEYNVPHGKLNRGLSVIHAYDTAMRSKLGEDYTLSEREIFLTHVLGWCVEWLQAFFLVADDLMDNSITRRGQPCWYKKPNVGYIAINDSIMLENAIFQLLKIYFKSEPYYIDLVELFLDIAWKTEVGQLHDLLTSAPQTVDFSLFTMEKYKLIVKYKTAYYSFYLPVAEALIMAGVSDPASLKTAEHILLIIGEYFQIQDDYLDCYGAPEVIGKIGTDIQDNKCSWLVVKALSMVTPAQRAVLAENYAHNDPACIQRVKDLYNELGLEQVFKTFEEDTYTGIIDLIHQSSKNLPSKIFMDFVNKIFRRTK